MNVSRLACIAVGFWLAVATEVAVLGRVPGLSVPASHGFVWTGWGLAIHLLAVTVLSVACGWWLRSAASALVAAAVVCGVSLALDAALTAPIFVKSYGALFGKASFWLGYALAFAALYASVKTPSRNPVNG